MNHRSRGFLRRIERLEALPPSSEALLAEIHRITALIDAGHELPPISKNKVTRMAMQIVACIAAANATMPGRCRPGEGR